MLIVQISDTHIAAPGQMAYDRYDTSSSLELTVEMINELDPQPAAVLHTGDIVASGAASEYRQFKTIINKLKAPLFLIPGNHDDRTEMKAELADGAAFAHGDSEFLHYSANLGDGTLRLIACDSVIPGSAQGGFCPPRLDWLAEQLKQSETTPTIVALHHPPFPSGLSGASAQGLVEGASRFTELLNAHQNVVRVLAGHVHRPITASIGGTIGFASPSTCYPFGLDTGPLRELKITAEPPAFAVHQWFSGSLLTHVMPIGNWAAPVTLLRDGKRVLN